MNTISNPNSMGLSFGTPNGLNLGGTASAGMSTPSLARTTDNSLQALALGTIPGPATSLSSIISPLAGNILDVTSPTTQYGSPLKTLLTLVNTLVQTISILVGRLLGGNEQYKVGPQGDQQGAMQQLNTGATGSTVSGALTDIASQSSKASSAASTAQNNTAASTVKDSAAKWDVSQIGDIISAILSVVGPNKIVKLAGSFLGKAFEFGKKIFKKALG